MSCGKMILSFSFKGDVDVNINPAVRKVSREETMKSLMKWDVNLHLLCKERVQKGDVNFETLCSPERGLRARIIG